MTLTIDVSPAVLAQLQQEAERHGLDPVEHARHLIEQNIRGERHRPFYETASSEEWDKRFVEWVESHNHLPALPPESFEWAALYGERG